MDQNKSDLDPSSAAELQHYQRVAIGLINQNQVASFQLMVTSDSMAPFLLPGDWVTIEICQAHDLKRGEVIVRLEPVRQDAQQPDWTVHRLVGKSTLGWITKGDHLRYFDLPITDSAILGRVTKIFRRDKWIDLQRFPWKVINRWQGLYQYGLGKLLYTLRSLWGRVKSGRGEE